MVPLPNLQTSSPSVFLCPYQLPHLHSLLLTFENHDLSFDPLEQRYPCALFNFQKVVTVTCSSAYTSTDHIIILQKIIFTKELLLELPWPSGYELRLSLERSQVLIPVKVIGGRQEGHPVQKCSLLQQSPN